MTERQRTPRPPRRRKPSAFPVAAGSIAAFLGLFGYMAYQLRTGHDPALGAQTASVRPAQTKRVVVKRIEHHVVITKLLPPLEEHDDAAPAQATAPSASVPAQPSAPVVVQQSTPAPAPAPAPAPVQTRTS
jgi:hypothetical protein